jgi:hypothetical protein
MQNVTWIVKLPYCACNVVKAKKYAKYYVHCKITLLCMLRFES